MPGAVARFALSTNPASPHNSSMDTGFSGSHHWQVYGHDWAVNFLRKSLAHRRVRHAYLLTGTQSIGKSTLAHIFAMALNCTHEDESQRPCRACRSCRLIISGNHPDLLYSETDPKSGALKIDSIRDVMRLIALKPYDSRYRVALFHDFDRAQPRAQDALLKTLEEPPPHAVLILIAQATGQIMSTISSRCQNLPLRPAPTAVVKDVLQQEGADEDTAELLAGLSGGRIGWALDALQNEEVRAYRQEILDELMLVLGGKRLVRFDIAEQLGKIASKDKNALRYRLEWWLTFWRDALLLAENSPIKPCNRDHLVQLQQLVQRSEPDAAHIALRATQKALRQLDTNANTRLLLEAMFLDYPGL